MLEISLSSTSITFESIKRTTLKEKLQDFKLNETFLRQEIKHLQYCKEAEDIILNDLKQSIEIEKENSFGLIGKLNEEKKQNLKLKSELSDLRKDIYYLKNFVRTEKAEFNKNLSNIEEDYLNKLNSLMLQESKFSELENRTKALQELMLKKQIAQLKDDLKYEKIRSENCGKTKVSLDKLNGQNIELIESNKSLKVEVSELKISILDLNEMITEVREEMQNLVKEKMKIQGKHYFINESAKL